MKNKFNVFSKFVILEQGIVNYNKSAQNKSKSSTTITIYMYSIAKAASEGVLLKTPEVDGSSNRRNLDVERKSICIDHLTILQHYKGKA